MKPCDCKSQDTVRMLKEPVLTFDGTSVTTNPRGVMIRIGPCTVELGHWTMQRIIEWYHEDQD